MIAKEEILPDLQNRKYQIKIAETEREVDSALRLRFNIFGKELNRGFDFKNGRDYDAFDDQCHHLIVKDKIEDKIVGTYRLQTYEQAIKGEGFYTDKRFLLGQLPGRVLANSFEVGRACIADGHRNGKVLFLLWKGLAGYLEFFNKRYMFGTAALDTVDKKVAYNTFYYLKDEGFLHPDYLIDVRPEYMFDGDDFTNKNGDVDIPPLLKNYLQVGTKICSMPAFTQQTKLIHFFILLDIETITDKTRKLFFG